MGWTALDLDDQTILFGREHTPITVVDWAHIAGPRISLTKSSGSRAHDKLNVDPPLELGPQKE